MRTLLVCTLFLVVPMASYSQERPIKKALLLGIDGCRTDALLAANMPNVHGLIKEGAFGKDNDVLGNRPSGADTVSGPGWTTMLTGTWGDKHRVWNNGFSNGPSRSPSFFSRLLEDQPKAKPRALVAWKVMTTHLFAQGEGAELVLDGAIKGFVAADEVVTDRVVEVLTNEDPTVVYMFFGQVDVAGHQFGFHPKFEKYQQALARVDYHVGRILKALAKRKTIDQEDWLILMGADHGGTGDKHSGKKNVQEVRKTFFLAHGPSVQKGDIEGPTDQVDFAATILTHLGVRLRPEWGLDGKAVGLKK